MEKKYTSADIDTISRIDTADRRMDTSTFKNGGIYIHAQRVMENGEIASSTLALSPESVKLFACAISWLKDHNTNFRHGVAKTNERVKNKEVHFAQGSLEDFREYDKRVKESRKEPAHDQS